jgi:tRNA(Ile)-lysidine synthase
MTKQDFYQIHKAYLNKQQQYLLAISGGLDSMVLLHLMHSLGMPIVIAHVNYQLRGEASLADQQLVQQTAQQLSIPIEVLTTQLPEVTKGFNLQAWAREQRYTFFKQILQQHQLNYIVTAHHLNDNIETVLLNITRGTSIHGLGGMAILGNPYLKPLLPFTRQQLEQYALANNVVWRQDESNLTNKYRRNAIRNQLLPAWQQIQHDIEPVMQANILRWQQAESIYKEALHKLIRKHVVVNKQELLIPINYLLKHKIAEVLLHEVLMDKGFTSGQITEAVKLLNAHNGSIITSDTHQILKHKLHLIVSPLKAKENTITFIKDANTWYTLPVGKIIFRPSTVISTDALEATVPLALLQLPVVVRAWRQGDYIYPLGMPKKKKISRLLIDLKIPQHKKNEVYVVEQNGKIIWVLGIRLDDRFKVMDAHKSLINIQYKPD